MPDTFTAFKYIAITATATAALTALPFTNSRILPTANYLVGLGSGQKISRKYNHETVLDNPYYLVDEMNFLTQVNIMHGFMTELLEHSQDLDSEITEYIGNNFWKLL